MKDTGSNSWNLHPETLVLHTGYKPADSEGALKIPRFDTTTFVASSAEKMKRAFQIETGLEVPEPEESHELIYSRVNNPNVEILEERLVVWDGAEACALFVSGMAAIRALFDTFLSPGDAILCSGPLYGGTTSLLDKHFSDRWGVRVSGFTNAEELEGLFRAMHKSDITVKLVHVETPANPTLHLVDLKQCADIAHSHEVLLVVDNTFLGPCFQHPLKYGADLVIYSATKYIGGHNKTTAGACLGSKEIITELKQNRSRFGDILSPGDAQDLTTSLETLSLRMEKQASNAKPIADYLVQHPKVKNVFYLGHLDSRSEQGRIFAQQCESPGAMVSFELRSAISGEKNIFRFLNALKIFKLAVSLGGTISLMCHPASSTHLSVPRENLEKAGMVNLIRISIGIEHPDDLVRDIEQALGHVF